MAYTRNWDETTPGDHTALPDTPLKMREIKIDVAERLKDFFYGFTSGETDTAAKKVTFKEQTSDPTNVEDTAIIYAKEVSGVTEIFVMDSDGNIKQITSGGKLNIASDEAVLLTGDQTVAGNKTFSGNTTFSGTVTVSSTSNFTEAATFDGSVVHNDPVTFSDTATFNSTASFTESVSMDKTLTLKASSVSTNGYSYLPNGLILQWGTDSTDSDTATVTFPLTFPVACLCVIATAKNSAAGDANVATYNWTTTGFTIKHEANERPTAWMAIGH